MQKAAEIVLSVIEMDRWADFQSEVARGQRAVP
jgi:hypothetical protein